MATLPIQRQLFWQCWQTLTVNTILTIRMKANNALGPSSQPLPLEDRGVDIEDEDNECSDDEYAFTLEPSEEAAIANSRVRKYRLPKINFKAESYTDLIDWEASFLTEPPLTLGKTDAEVLALKETPLDVPKYPCHTQAVERAVRLVSEASAAVIGPDKRDGFIRQRIEARNELPKFESKKDYFPKIRSQPLSECE